MATAVRLTESSAEILLAAQRREVWRSRRSGRIFTSSGVVTAAANRMLREGLLMAAPETTSWQRESDGGPLVVGDVMVPTSLGRELLAALPDWSGLVLGAGVGPRGVEIPAEIRETIRPIVPMSHLGLSVDALAALGRCVDDRCPVCPLPFDRMRDDA